MAEKVTYLSVIRNSGFKFLWANQLLVQLAYNTLNFALIVWVFKLLDSSIAISALMLAIYLPSVLFGLFAGFFVDIVDRRKLIILIDILLALSFISFIFIKGSYPLILLNVFWVNTLAQFFMPSESSSIPMLVSSKQLFLANSLFSLTLYGSLMMGFSIGGPLLAHLGLNSVFILGAIMLTVAFFVAQKLPAIKVARVEKKYEGLLSPQNLKRVIRLTKEETKQTLGFIRSKLQVTVAIVLLSVAQGVIGMLAVMMPSYLERVLRIHATDSSYFVMLPLGLGMVVGAILLGKFYQNFPKRSIVIRGIIGVGLLFLLIGIVPIMASIFQSPELPSRIIRPRYFSRVLSLSSLFAVVAFALGFCAVSIIIPCQTVLQENTTIKNRGKIFAVLSVLMMAVTAFPVVLAGVFSEVFGVTFIFLVLGAIIFAIGLLTFKPNIFLQEDRLPLRVRQFLGLGHWVRAK